MIDERIRFMLLTAIVAIAVYANSIPNRFAYDDAAVIEQSELIRSGDVLGAFNAPYWWSARGGAGLYRPVTIATYAAEWRVHDGNPHAMHAVNVVLHALISVLVFLLLARLTSVRMALLGALVFAVHPLHTEVVANIVGRAEMLAAGFVLAALLIHDRMDASTSARVGALVAIPLLYALGLGSKEMAVTLPGLMVLLTVHREGWVDGIRKSVSQWPVHLLLVGVLGTYLLVRQNVLGTVTGELPAPWLAGLDPLQRVFTALSVWPEYVRLLFFPLDLVSDYAPGVLISTRSFDVDVLAGLLAGVLAAGLVVRAWNRERGLSTGVLWFGLALLPISNLLFTAGVLLAERTLYIPSIGLSIAVAFGVGRLLESRPQAVRAVWIGSLAVLALLSARTVVRNPDWEDSLAVVRALATAHPEAYSAIRARAEGLERSGDPEEAARLYEIALEMAPGTYSLLVEVGRFYGRQANWQRAGEILDAAVEIFPHHPAAWQTRSEQLLAQGRGRDAHRVALNGLAYNSPDRELWMLVSESYIAKMDYPAALRARVAALGAEPETAQNWNRMADILEWMERFDDARDARARAVRLQREEDARPGRPAPSGVPGS